MDTKPSSDSSQSNNSWLHPSRWNVGDETKLEAGLLIHQHYRLEEEIGQGSMGEVWKAVDLIQVEGDARDCHVALKFLNQDFKQHPDALKVLVREFHRYKKLNHPNIVKAYGLDRFENTFFLVMEFLKGMSLKEIIQNHPNGLPLKEAEPIIKDMAHALAYAHKEGLAHLDFKPGNVFYESESKHTKVIDFGIARPLEQSERERTKYDLKNLGALTEAYASYEMLLNLDPDPRDDIYGLACVTYGLLSGKHPFNRENAIDAESKKRLPKRIKGLNHQQNKALLRALAFKRNKRTRTVDDFLAELFPEKKPKYLLVFLVMLLGIVAGFAAWYQVKQQSEEAPLAAEYKPENQTEKTETGILPKQKQCKQSTVVNRLLKTAEEYMREERYIYPPVENALEKYQKVLVVCPNNEQAKKNLGKIADIYEGKAQYKLNKGHISACQDNIKNGLRAVPEHSGLLALQSRCQ